MYVYIIKIGNPPRANCLGSEALGVVALGGP